MNEPSEKIRIIVAFGDIEGFTAFCDSVTNDEIEYEPLMTQFDDIVDDAAKDTGYTFSDTGDGFMCTVELAKGHNCKIAIKVLTDLWNLLSKLKRLFEKKGHLVPDGIRMVLASGYVKRKRKRNGAVVLRGKHINMAHNFLEYARGKGMVCHLSFKQLISPDQAEKAGVSFNEFKRDWFVVTMGRGE